MARYYAIRFGSIYLTSDGTSGGIPAKLNVEGWQNLINPVTGNVVRANAGNAIRQTILRPGGDLLIVSVETWLTKSVWDSIKTLFDAANSADTAITVIGTGDTGNFTKTCKPDLQAPYSAARFRSEKIFQPVFRLHTV